MPFAGVSSTYRVAVTCSGTTPFSTQWVSAVNKPASNEVGPTPPPQCMTPGTMYSLAKGCVVAPELIRLKKLMVCRGAMRVSAQP